MREQPIRLPSHLGGTGLDHDGLADESGASGDHFDCVKECYETTRDSARYLQASSAFYGRWSTRCRDDLLTRYNLESDRTQRFAPTAK